MVVSPTYRIPSPYMMQCSGCVLLTSILVCRLVIDFSPNPSSFLMASKSSVYTLWHIFSRLQLIKFAHIGFPKLRMSMVSLLGKMNDTFHHLCLAAYIGAAILPLLRVYTADGCTPGIAAGIQSVFHRLSSALANDFTICGIRITASFNQHRVAQHEVFFLYIIFIMDGNTAYGNTHPPAPVPVWQQVLQPRCVLPGIPPRSVFVVACRALNFEMRWLISGDGSSYSLSCKLPSFAAITIPSIS